ncbi:MAG TPA: retropepsin-like aspartic protease [Aggregatilineaceae bacterium]|nr:retropepsin-like aspartic protease [Aggregatilineaceae bacterium]
MSEIKLIIKPDEEEAGAAEIFVDGRIDGRAYRFLLDTGAANTCLIWDEYTAAFDSTEQRQSSGVFQTSRDDFIMVPQLEVGPIMRQNFTVVRKHETHADRRNLMGMDVLKDHCCTFLFDEQRMVIDEDDGQAELILDQRFHPYLDVHWETGVAHAVWDTGAGLTVVDTNFIERYPALFQSVGQSTGTDATGTRVETPMFVMAACRIGGRAFPACRVAGVDLSHVNASIEIPMDLILGYNLLSQARWVFDFPRRKWSLGSERKGRA